MSSSCTYSFQDQSTSCALISCTTSTSWLTSYALAKLFVSAQLLAIWDNVQLPSCHNEYSTFWWLVSSTLLFAKQVVSDGWHAVELGSLRPLVYLSLHRSATGSHMPRSSLRQRTVPFREYINFFIGIFQEVGLWWDPWWRWKNQSGFLE